MYSRNILVFRDDNATNENSVNEFKNTKFKKYSYKVLENTIFYKDVEINDKQIKQFSLEKWGKPKCYYDVYHDVSDFTTSYEHANDEKRNKLINIL